MIIVLLRAMGGLDVMCMWQLAQCLAHRKSPIRRGCKWSWAAPLGPSAHSMLGSLFMPKETYRARRSFSSAEGVPGMGHGVLAAPSYLRPGLQQPWQDWREASSFWRCQPPRTARFSSRSLSAGVNVSSFLLGLRFSPQSWSLPWCTTSLYGAAHFSTPPSPPHDDIVLGKRSCEGLLTVI